MVCIDGKTLMHPDEVWSAYLIKEILDTVSNEQFVAGSININVHITTFYVCNFANPDLLVTGLLLYKQPILYDKIALLRSLYLIVV